MSDIQLARLTQYTLDLQSYIEEVKTIGDLSLVAKLEKKLSYLESRIAERMAA